MLSREDLLKVRTVLVTPGHDTEKIVKGLASAADLVVLDLEDSVPTARKAEARAAVRKALDNVIDDRMVAVRVNALGSGELEADLVALAGTNVGAVMLPKCNGYIDVESFNRKALPTAYAVIALVESPLGVLRSYDTTLMNNVVAIAFGQADFLASVGCSNDAIQLVRAARAQVVMAAHAGGVAALDSPCVMKSRDQAHWEAEESRVFGFTGKGCIFPSHIDIVARYMVPAKEELEFAKRGLEAGSEGVVFLEREQIAFGPPMEKWCKKIVARA